MALSGTFPLDGEYWQRMNRNLVNNGYNPSDSPLVFALVIDDLTNRLWQDHSAETTANYAAAGFYMLPKFVSSIVTSSAPQADQFVSNVQQQLALGASYTVLTVDQAAYDQALRAAYQIRYNGEPPAIIDKTLSIERLTNGNYQVAESIRYQQ